MRHFPRWITSGATPAAAGPAPRRRRWAGLALPFLLTAVFPACAPRLVERPPANGPAQGTASWYGDDFHGRTTSSGDRYNMYRLTAASRTLPLGTKVRVTRMDNGRDVVVTINDRGPFVGNRIIDLSYEAARRLDMLETGIAEVRLAVITEASASTPAAAPTATPPASSAATPVAATAVASVSPRWVSLGAFASERSARWLAARSSAAGRRAEVRALSLNGRNFYQVVLGPLEGPEEAERVLSGLRRLGLRGTVEPTGGD